MHLLPTLLTALSLLMPTTGRERVAPVGLNTAVVSWEKVSFDQCVATIRRSHDLPSGSRLFLESLDESALGEDDSDEIEPSMATSHVVFGELSFTSYLLSLSPSCTPAPIQSAPAQAPLALRC